MQTVTPAYGRDYKSQKAALADWNEGEDFILQDIMSPWDGKPCSKRDFDAPVMIRYYKNQRVVVTK
jgi:hypothetical protein